MTRGLSFDEAVAWLQERLGREATVAVCGAGGGNTYVVAAGRLGPGDDAFQLVDPRGGSPVRFAVGDRGHLQLLEGDVEHALTDEDDGQAHLVLTCREVQVSVVVDT